MSDFLFKGFCVPSKKNIWLLAAVLLLSSCTKSSSTYDEQKRAELMRSSEVVVTATYRRAADLSLKAKIDVMDARSGGIIKKVENGVIFRVKKTLKGTPLKNEFTVGIGNPNLAFGIQPGEEPGKKLYTLYLRGDSKYDVQILIGAEWEEQY